MVEYLLSIQPAAHKSIQSQKNNKQNLLSFLLDEESQKYFL
jgi:hypothetical protein